MTSKDELMSMIHLSLEKCSITFPRFILAAMTNYPENKDEIIVLINEWEKRCQCEKYIKEK